MHLKIKNNKYTVKHRSVTQDSVNYFGVSPTVEEISGEIVMCSNDGFLLSKDDADKFQRRYMDGDTLVLTNLPEPEPVPEPEPPGPTPQDDTDAMLVDHEYRLTMLELGLA